MDNNKIDEAKEISLEMLVIAYKGVRTPKQNIYYDKMGAKKVANKITSYLSEYKHASCAYTSVINSNL